MIKVVFFDLYGTLLIFGDMNKAWKKWLSVFYASLKKNGLSISLDEFSILCDNFMSGEEPQFLERDFTLYEMRIKKFADDQKLRISDNDIKKIAGMTVESWQSEVRVDPEAAAILKKLKKDYITGLVSNFDHPPHIHKLLSEYGLTELLDIIIISGEESVKKPDPEIFNRIFNSYDLQPGEVLFVGDSEEDMNAAGNAGLHFALIERNNNVESMNARDYTVSANVMRNTEFKEVIKISKLSDVCMIIDQIN
jgi:putative hydrolase of the HAD superfamily